MPDSAEPAPHTHRVTLLLALVGVLLAGYALWRADNARDRGDSARDRIAQFESAQSALRTELAALAERDAQAHAQLDKQWRELSELPQQVRDLAAGQEDLRARTERPQRAWSRAEALYLIELAQRRLSFDRDTATAISALESADARLASLRDASLNGVRERIAKDLRALRSIPEPDRAGIVARLLALEGQTDELRLKGILVGQRSTTADSHDADSALVRAWRSVAGVFDRMFTVRRIDSEHSDIVSLEEQSLRRQHFALLMYSARSAAIRSDEVAYRAALSEAQIWLDRYFEGSPASDVSREIASLRQINIAPPLPDISATAQMLSRAAGIAPSAP